MKWVEKNGREIVLVSKDLVRLSCAIKRWDYFDTTKIKLLVMVKETLADCQRHEARDALIASVDMPYMWAVNTYQVRVNRYPERDIQMCVTFYNDGGYYPITYADLSFSWATSLLEEIPSREPIVMDGRHYNQNPDGSISRYREVGYVSGTIYHDHRLLENERPHPRSPWFSTTYINLRLPNFRIEQSSTRTDLYIDTDPHQYEFRGYVRLAVKNGSVLIPTIPARVINTPGAWENYEI